MFRAILEKHHYDWRPETIEAFRYAFFQGASWVIVTLGKNKDLMKDLHQEMLDEMEKTKGRDPTVDSEARH
jgi:hypothetical protein